MGEDWYLFGYGYLYPTVQKGLFFFPFASFTSKRLIISLSLFRTLLLQISDMETTSGLR